MNRLQIGCGLSRACPGIDKCLDSVFRVGKSQSNLLTLFTIILNNRTRIKHAKYWLKGSAQVLRNSFILAKG